MRKYIVYSEIQLHQKVYSPNKNEIGEIVSISNFASLAGISEPIFTVKFERWPGGLETFGLKYIKKMMVK